MKTTALCVFLLAANVLPANADDPCPQILSNGIWETLDVSDKAVDSKSFANWACKRRGEDDTIGGGYGSGYGYVEYKMSKDDCSANQGAAFFSHGFREKMQTEAKHIVEAWSACINRYGSYASIKYADTADVFAIYLHTHFPTTNHGRAKIRAG